MVTIGNRHVKQLKNIAVNGVFCNGTKINGETRRFNTVIHNVITSQSAVGFGRNKTTNQLEKEDDDGVVSAVPDDDASKWH